MQVNAMLLVPIDDIAQALEDEPTSCRKCGHDFDADHERCCGGAEGIDCMNCCPDHKMLRQPIRDPSLPEFRIEAGDIYGVNMSINVAGTMPAMVKLDRPGTTTTATVPVAMLDDLCRKYLAARGYTVEVPNA
jgi:hypothetical protein